MVIPFFFGGAALEVYGSVVYDWRVALFNPRTNSLARRERIRSIVAHEVSHQVRPERSRCGPYYSTCTISVLVARVTLVRNMCVLSSAFCPSFQLQWFGNHATMEFWDDLFLSEAFATFWETVPTGRAEMDGFVVRILPSPPPL